MPASIRGSVLVVALACTPPSVFETLSPGSSGGVEVCNGRDDDRDGAIDEDEPTLCDDGDPCTVGRCEGADGCFQDRAPDTCVIGGRCVTAGTASDDDVCAICDPLFSTTDWSPAGADVSCDDGEACTTNDRCDGQGACRGDGEVPDIDEQEPSSPLAPHDTLRTVADDGDDRFLVEGTFHTPDDVDTYLFTLLDENQCCVGSPCVGSTKQPQPSALVTGSAVEVCVQVFCFDGSPPVALDCIQGYALGDDTCCDPVEAIAQPDCSATDDSVDVFVDVFGTGSTCGSYQVRMGNTDSGCGF
ncbi:MAG: hypothetical protein AAF602_09135 [Myxococcota bacterium]